MINIDELNEDELVDLHNRIVGRLKYLDQLRAHEAMLKFRVGDRVRFQSRDGREVTGRLTKYNQKTVTIVTNDGRRWNVSPGLLKKEAVDMSSSSSATVVQLKRE